VNRLVVLASAALAVVLGSFALARAADPEPAPPDSKFNHARHVGSVSKAKLDMTKCTSCHAVDKDGANLRPGADGHQPCMQSGCHLDDFLDKRTTLCLGCHASSDNFRKNPADRVFAPGGKKEHFVEFSHQAHMRPRVAGSKAQAVVCQTCHWVDKATFKAVEHPGHPQCAACHATSKNLPMSQCDGCHNDGDPAKHFDKHRKDVQLRDNFSHEHVGHRFFDKEKMTQPIQCETCHYKVEKFDNLRDLRGTAIIDSVTMKNNCSKCHDVHDTKLCTTCHTKATIASGNSFNYHGL
jgi:hypothetical protein